MGLPGTLKKPISYKLETRGNIVSIEMTAPSAFLLANSVLNLKYDATADIRSLKETEELLERTVIS